jgi:hypothetical protein
MKLTQFFVISAFALIGLLPLLGAAGCDGPRPSSDQIQRQQQEQINMQSVQQIGMPAIVNFQEKRLLKMILEKRDQEIKTITYTQDMNGKLHKLCDSIGYGIPYATQYTNPQRVARSNETPGQGNVTLPQADPNGLFSPSNAEGTWILCLNTETNKTSPVYVEPRVIVSPFPLVVQ